MHDVAVIGCGTAGTFAALELVRGGASVAVIASGAPSAAMGRGIAFVGAGFPADEGFAGAWASALPALTAGPDDWLAFDGAVVGAARAADLTAGRKSIGGDDVDVLVVDVPGLPGPTAPVLAWKLGEALGRRLRSVTLRLHYAVGDFELTPAVWARRFDGDAGKRDELVAHLARRVQDERPGTVLLPPILGLATKRDVIGVLAASARCKVLELAGGPGWPPGLRVGEALSSAIRKSGVAVVRGRAVGARTGPRRRIEAVLIEGGGEVEAGEFVLATGGAAGGGIRFEGRIEEPALGLPVFIGGDLAPEPAAGAGLDPRTLFGERLEGPHSLAGAGVRVDDDFRPLDREGLRVHPNLRAAGHVVACAEVPPPPGLTDPGPPALSGWRVARAIQK